MYVCTFLTAVPSVKALIHTEADVPPHVIWMRVAGKNSIYGLLYDSSSFSPVWMRLKQ